ncbi:hypothetical protein CEXT_321991 [Caerostris extrusa]|uniref:Uncharacterized protein n=1 Tax=Caerostris extrusa TaxID=172846 RepID=A0AAV4QHQ6_CAEEX|nr:hypothetical protein CEXT_321991 [Caerostris extrusa]
MFLSPNASWPSSKVSVQYPQSSVIGCHSCTVPCSPGLEPGSLRSRYQRSRSRKIPPRRDTRVDSHKRLQLDADVTAHRFSHFKNRRKVRLCSISNSNFHLL